MAGGRLAWGGFSAHIAPRNGQNTLTSPGGDVIYLANRGILFIPRATAVAGEVIATMTPTHSNTSLFVGFSGPATVSLRILQVLSALVVYDRLRGETHTRTRWSGVRRSIAHAPDNVCLFV